MDFVDFLRTQYPLCLGLPFHGELVKANLYYKLSERSEADFNGRNLFEQQCPNANICDNECRGRPVPKYPELEKIIAKYNPTEGMWGGQEVWFININTCKSCPFKDQCTKICPSMSAFDRKSRDTDDFRLEMAIPMEAVTDDVLEYLWDGDTEDTWYNKLNLTMEDVAWDCLSEEQQAAIMLIQIQGKTFEQAATIRGVHVRSISKSYESGMDKLKEFGLARRALKHDTSCNFALEYYKGGYGMSEISKMYHVGVGTVHRKLSEFKKKHGLTT